ncbi:ABC transporter substrate-binding protein [Roseovarius aquimarinus]|uniref:ABC transporter substrate-binding protein n=1 Tax=Roseovarius aquimarinus TaxID=1229156 RepID=A0ABW7I600_9RHOB
MSARGTVLALLAAWAAVPALAEGPCGATYRVQAGDTLESVAARHFGAGADWAPLYYANLAALPPTDGAAEIAAGTELYIPCPPGAAPASPKVLEPGEADITLVVADGHGPLADRTWPGGGMGTALLVSALAVAPDPLSHRMRWAEAGAGALDGAGDIRFPVIAPDCSAEGAREICDAWHFSDPVFELPMMLFAATGGALAQVGAEEIDGRRICRPEGAPVDDLDRAGRRWISEGRITLLRAPSAEACLEMVVEGAADAAGLDLYLGAARIAAMGLQGRVAPLEPPLSRETLRAAVPRGNWRGTTLIWRLNAGLERLRASGQRDDIVAQHMRRLAERLR